jgi:hypothetical protein
MSTVELGELASAEKFQLHQNFPNPFNPSTTIAFTLHTGGEAFIQIFDVRGALVHQFDRKQYVEGEHHVLFESKDLESGVYFCRLTIGNYSQTKKLLLIR